MNRYNRVPAFASVLVFVMAGAAYYLMGNGPLFTSRENRVTLNAWEFAFSPSALRAAQGEITFSVVNRGKIPHVLAIQGLGTRASTPIIRPGERKTLSVKLERSGEYQLVCPLKGHAERGMVGSLQVRIAG